MEMSVYALFHCMPYEGRIFLGAYKYLSQAQEAEYAYGLENAEVVDGPEWTEIREVLLGAAPSFDAGKIVED
jgi:hypothetical protein